MKLARWLVGISCAVGIVSVDSKVFSQSANQVAQRPQSQWSTVQSYCFGCHNDGVRAGNLFLDKLGPESVSKQPEIFEKVVRKLRGRQMPPPGTPQPSQREIDALVGWLESTLDEASKARPAGQEKAAGTGARGVIKMPQVRGSDSTPSELAALLSIKPG